MLLQSLKIFLFVALSVIGYGIVHDQVTARICIEYFTVAHEPTLVDSDSPTIVGLAWGVYSTWWVGVVVGVASAVRAQVGSWPRVSFGQMIKPGGYLVLAIAIASLIAGTLAFALAEFEVIRLGPPMSAAMEPSKHSGFLSDRWSHRAAHAVGLLGGSGICAGIWLVRKRRAERMRVGEGERSNAGD